MEQTDQRIAPGTAEKSAYFAGFLDACRANDPKAALNALIAWFGSCCEGSDSSSIRRFAAGLGDDDLTEQLTRLQEAVVSGNTAWKGTELYHAVDRARRKLGTAEE